MITKINGNKKVLYTIKHQFNLTKEDKKTRNTITCLSSLIKQSTLKERVDVWFNILLKVVTNYYK